MNSFSKKRVKGAKSVTDHRSEFEIDLDRLLFSTPVRRLADKTQVFPLEKNDSVRNRLTHSMEVSNLARSIGNALVGNSSVFSEIDFPMRTIPPILATVGLMHDIGNPPFGHQGENAIRDWVNSNKVLHSIEHIDDFKNFEGNAQTFRLVTKLQLLDDHTGLDLTFCTLAASVKYPVFSSGIDKTKPFRKKFNFFESERGRAEEVMKEVGQKLGERHPLIFIVEACDDIAYSVFDVEDGVKKGIISYHDVISYLSNKSNNDTVINRLLDKCNSKYVKDLEEGLSPNELNDVSMQRFRAYAISEMVNSTVSEYEKSFSSIKNYRYFKDLLNESESAELVKLLKELASLHLFCHKSVLELELTGYNVIKYLMNCFWQSVSGRIKDPKGFEKTPFQNYCYSLISENYKRQLSRRKEGSDLSDEYIELQLAVDMVAGMTDSFAIDLYEQLKRYNA
ncbi:dGTP triphosphohydrolase [Halobacteriovorax sp. DA5]|uniref:dGTP triphosphohydrolase n=1 Tax=Halobacteriovorax sp. DA5 TaxID=2067553 RepID=UPI000CD0EAA1|nr:dNTP triphosphohydrolase [Halobacteriovorax sp. DA5]POB14394.1 deoxyguanosinetriphosphate triphosphohydrolase [Halobacteriovorax sp. DA5]